MTLTWSPVAGAQSYILYWSTSPGVTTAATRIAGAASPYAHSDLVASVAHHYRVAAANAYGESGLSTEAWAYPTVTPAEAAADGTIHVPSELTTIQAGLNAAGAGNTVLVADGVYTENIVWPLVDGITLTSEHGAVSTIIDGGGRDSVIIIAGQPATMPTATITGFKIVNGASSHTVADAGYNGGGGIYAYYATPTIRDNIITENEANEAGGGIQLGTLAGAVIDGNWIMDNRAAGNGGGINCRNGSASVITDNQIRNNHSDYCGGGVATSPTSSPLELTGNTVSSNFDAAVCPTADCDNICIGSVGDPAAGGTNDACDTCLSTCQGLAGCCTGSGCLCYDECTLSVTCPPGTSMCCSSYGDCFCLAFCPY